MHLYLFHLHKILQYQILVLLMNNTLKKKHIIKQFNRFFFISLLFVDVCIMIFQFFLLPVPIPSKRDSTLSRGNLDVLVVLDEGTAVLSCKQ